YREPTPEDGSTDAQRVAFWEDLRASARSEALFIDPIHKELYRKAPREGVANTISVSGQSFALGANGSNFGNFFLPLKPFHDRRNPNLHSDRIADRLKAQFAKYVPHAKLLVLGPPAVNGLGTSNGFKIIVEDRRGDVTVENLRELQG